MKKLFISIVLVFSIQAVNADVYLTYDMNTKEVKDFSPIDDCVVQSGWKKITLQGKLHHYPLSYHPTYYKYENGQFVVNIQKLSDEAIVQQEKEEIKEEVKEIAQKMKAMAIDELKKEGKIIKYHNNDGTLK